MALSLPAPRRSRNGLTTPRVRIWLWRCDYVVVTGRAECAKNDRISSRAASVGCPASSIRWAVTTLCGLATTCSKNGGVSWLAALSGSTRPMKRSPRASLVGREPLRPAEPISLEAVSHHGQVLALEALAHRGELLGRDLQPGGIVQRQRRLGQHRCEHRRLEHHRQREIAREAHPDRAHARTAALLVREPRQRPQPLRHRTRLVRGERAELGADARPPEDGRALLHAAAPRRRGRTAKACNGEARIPHPATEASDVRTDARHLGHHDHRRSCAGDVHRLRDAFAGDRAGIEVCERIVVCLRAFRHPRRPFFVDLVDRSSRGRSRAGGPGHSGELEAALAASASARARAIRSN